MADEIFPAPSPFAPLVEIDPRATAIWPARTWVPAERVTAGMMNVVRDQLNELHAGGQWLDVPFNAADYTASGMAWNVTAHSPSAYTIINKTMIYTIYLQTSMHSLAGATNSLAIKLPGNATCAKTAIGSGWSNGIAALSWTSIFPYARGGSQSITLHGPGLGNYNAGGWELYMTIALPIL